MKNPSSSLISLGEVMAALSPDEREAVKMRSMQIAQEIDGLKALRELSEQSQQQIAQSLGIKQPAVHKMEKQADLYLSTLRRFVEAAGGRLELVIDMPGRKPIRLTGIGDLAG